MLRGRRGRFCSGTLRFGDRVLRRRVDLRRLDGHAGAVLRLDVVDRSAAVRTGGVRTLAARRAVELRCERGVIVFDFTRGRKREAIGGTLGGTIAPPAAAFAAPVAEARAIAAAFAAGFDARATFGQHFAFINPDFDADAPERGERFDVRVVDVGAQRVQRNLSIVILLGARDLGATQATGDHHLHSASAGFHRAHDRLLHRAPEGDAFLELIDDVLADQTRIELGMLDLHDVDLNGFLRQVLEAAPDVFDPDATLTDDDARLSGVDDDAGLIGAAFDLDFRNRRGTGEPPKILANRGVFVEPGTIILFLVPAAVPRPRDSKSQPDRMDLLSHYFFAPALAAVFFGGRLAGLAGLTGLAGFADLADSTAARRVDLVESAIEAPARRFGGRCGAVVETTIVTCDMRLRLNAARPCARGSRRLVKPPPGPPSTMILATESSS